MIELKGTLKERLEKAVSLVCTEVTEEEVAGVISLYEKAGIKLLPSAIDFFRQYGGAYRSSYIMLKDPAYNTDISLNCYEILTDFYYSDAYDPKEVEKDMLRRLDCALDEIDMVREFAKEEVCPIGEIGYYYPAVVYIGENGKLFCVYEYKEEIDIFNTPAEILESCLGNNPPIGVDRMPIRTTYDWKDNGMYTLDADRFKLSLTPKVHEKDLLEPVNTSLKVNVFSYGFSADSSMDINARDLGKFAVQLNELYKSLNGSAELNAPYGDSYLVFTAAIGGHIRISGCIHNENAYGCTQKLCFENEIDQTYLRDFAKALSADYRKYAE